MKKELLLSLLFLNIITVFSIAQPTFGVKPNTLTTSNGNTICLPLETIDFTDIESTQFTISWDNSKLQFTGVQNLNTDIGLQTNNFNTYFSNHGKLGFDWRLGNDCNELVTGHTLADNTVLFDLCFSVIGENGSSSTIDITGDVFNEIVTRTNVGCFNIGLLSSSSTINISSGLDVNLIDFRAIEKDGVVLLSWQIATEFNLKNYLVERSTSPQNFQTIQQFSSRRLSQIAHYNYVDDDVQANQSYYYRLAIEEDDGTMTYSDTKNISIEASNAITCFPNPTTGTITIQYPKALIGEFNLLIFDALGRQMNPVSSVQTDGEILIDVASFATGLYYLQFNGDTIEWSEKIVLK